MRTFYLLGLFCALTAFSMVAANCSGCDDDDDDNNDDNDAADDDAADDDAADDDATDDDSTTDDDTAENCEGYDLIVDGETDTLQELRGWLAYLNIEIDTGAISGIIDPDDEEIAPYDVTGQRFDQTTGELEGSFPTPADMAELCPAETVSNHCDFTIIEGAFTGDIAYYCGTISEENLLFTYEATGEVTCGDFAM